MRRFVNLVQATVRTNFCQIGDGRPAAADDRLQVRQPQDRGPAAAAAALRDLRLLAAGRRRASALRQGGARRPALVRPAAGFPHRGARPRQGAAGEERRHRAGRRQGRLRAEALPAGPRDAIQAEGVASLHASSCRRCSTSPTISIRRRDRAARRHVVRHDGDDPYLVVAADKGTATFSDIANGIARRARLLARRRLRVRRLGRLRPQEAWASPRAARGKRSSATSARWASTSTRRRSPSSGVGDMSGDVFGNGMLRERTTKLVAAFDHRDIFIDPIPIRQQASPSASACSICRARAGRTTTSR